MKADEERQFFCAPLGRRVRLVSWLTIILLGMVGIALVVAEHEISKGSAFSPWILIFYGCIVVAVVASGVYGYVLGYRIEGSSVYVIRPFRPVSLELSENFSMSKEPSLLSKSIRLFGIGGFLSFSGWFSHKKLGRYRAFVSDPARAILISSKGQRWLLSPADTEAFMEALQRVSANRPGGVPPHA